MADELSSSEMADDVVYMLESWSEAYPTNIFPEISKEDIEYINAVNPNLSSRFFAHVGRHLIKKGFKPAIDMLRQQASELEACNVHKRRGWEYAEELEQERRKQADRIAELEKELSWWRTNFKLPTETNEPRPNWLYAPQTKPLSDEEIDHIIGEHWKGKLGNRFHITLCRAVEKAVLERHGIK